MPCNIASGNILDVCLYLCILNGIFFLILFLFHPVCVMLQDESEDEDNLNEICQCDNFPYLIGALFVYKGLLVVFGLFLAYESRNVKYFYINDSRFVSIAMYIVVILVGIGAPLSLVLSVHFFVDAAFGLTVFMIISSTLSGLLIIFIPKVKRITEYLFTSVLMNRFCWNSQENHHFNIL